DRGQDVGARRDDLLDPVAGLELEVLDEAEKQRIRHRHGEQVLFEPHRHADALQGDVFRDEDDGAGIGRLVRETDVRETELIRERFGDLLLGGQVEADEHGTDALAGPFVLSERDLEILLRDQAGLNQTLTDLLAHARLWSSGEGYRS